MQGNSHKLKSITGTYTIPRAQVILNSKRLNDFSFRSEIKNNVCFLCIFNIIIKVLSSAARKGNAYRPEKKK